MLAFGAPGRAASAGPVSAGAKLPPPSTQPCAKQKTESTDHGVGLVTYCGPARIAVQFDHAVDDAGTKLVTYAAGFCAIEEGASGSILAAHFGTDIADGSTPVQTGVKVRVLDLLVAPLDGKKTGGLISGWFDTFGIASSVVVTIDKNHRTAKMSQGKNASQHFKGILDCGIAIALPAAFS